MGLLRKIFAGSDRYAVPAGRDIDCTVFEGAGKSMEVVGESHYQPALKATWDANNSSGRSRSVACFAILQPQPNNQ